MTVLELAQKVLEEKDKSSGPFEGILDGTGEWNGWRVVTALATALIEAEDDLGSYLFGDYFDWDL
jgi:hypothetical protein